MQTYATKGKDIQRKWYLVDATDKVLGRLASEVAQLLMGKNKTIYTDHLDIGDFVIVVNAEKIKLTGRKLEQKFYFHHTGYPGGAKEVRLDKMLKEKPERVIQYAVKGMLPHNSLGRHQLKKLKIYAGGEHPHQAQKPEPLEI
ncbi:MAG TPA: 50S ribosomal protein L13 [archaeon]|nr:50S ribosomal protein L13 [archaeon]